MMTEPTDWIGGLFTQQAVLPDEHPWIEQLGGNASYFRASPRDSRLLPGPSSPHGRGPRHALPELLATAAFSRISS